LHAGRRTARRRESCSHAEAEVQDGTKVTTLGAECDDYNKLFDGRGSIPAYETVVQV
jgi:hypothetical protein